jgi:stage V sporulation protein SpoVS
LGGRDIALAAGALAAFRAHDQAELRRWAGMGAIADAVDAVATLACWSTLPKTNRLLVLAAAAGAAVVGGTASRTANGMAVAPHISNSNVGVGAWLDGRAPLSRN